jgi:peroxiredoxin
MTPLNPGDPFPLITVHQAGGGDVELPGHLAGHFGVVLFYRGSWCPYCNAQLAAFQRAQESLQRVDVKVVALSVDDEATTKALVAKHHITFPVGHSADARALTDVTGAFVNPDPVHLQSTGFLLDPAGRVVVSVHSSGAIGRLVPADVIGTVEHLQSHAQHDPTS